MDSSIITFNPSLFNCPRVHSAWVDRTLGIQVEKIETTLYEAALKLDPQGSHKTWGRSLHEGNQTWVGLWSQTLQTPYSELKQICELLKPKKLEHLVDLGAGYGRMGWVLHLLYPETSFSGYEYVSERVIEGSRLLDQLGCVKARLIHQDLTQADFKLPEADFYFVYDYGTLEHIRHTLDQLKEMGDRKKFKVIARGLGTRSLIDHEHPWLSQVFDPHHEEHFSIYSMSM